jgi:hypothetical protein
MAGGISDDEPGSRGLKRHVDKSTSISAGNACDALLEIAPALGARRSREAGEGQDLPAVVNVRDLAKFLRISEKAVRHRVARGQLPRVTGSPGGSSLARSGAEKLLHGRAKSLSPGSGNAAGRQVRP